MPRFQNWPLILSQKIEEARHKPFRWGEHDCALFAADVILAMTGVDHATVFRGSYDSEDAAAYLLVQSGGLQSIVCSCLGQEINPKFAQRGDVVLVKTEERRVLGICIGAQSVCPGRNGLLFFRMKDWLTAWRVK